MGVFVIFPIAAALAVWFKRRFEIMVFPAIGLITMVLAIFGIVGNLRIGVYAAVLLAVPAIAVLIGHKKQIQKYVLTPGFAAFCIYLVFFFVYSRERYFNSDAVKMIYGPSLRSMFSFDSMRDHSPFYNLNNPFPLGTLWAYFCTRILGSYSEWKAIFAYDVLIVSGVLPLFCQIKKIREENWQWMLMIAVCLFLPLLKMDDAYRSFDMVIPQTTAMVYTYYIFYRLVHGAERKGDVLFAAYGIFVSCVMTRYGMFALIPLMVGWCAVAKDNRKKRKQLVPALFAGCTLAFVMHLYIFLSHEITWKALLYVPGSLAVSIVVGVLMATVIGMYNRGYRKTAVLIFVMALAAAAGVVVLILNHSPYKEYVIEEAVEFTNKLFVGTEEANNVIGKRVIRIYDTTFLFILMAISGMAHARINKRDKDGNLTLDVFHAAYIFGVVLYLLLLCVLYINVIRMPKANPIPKIATYVAPVVVISAAGVFFQAVRVWKKDTALVVTGAFLLLCVYTDPVGEIFNRTERDYVFPLLHECVENGTLTFTEDDKIFYMDPELFRDISVDFCWEAYPAGAEAISGLHFNADPYRWSGGEIQHTMSKEELAEKIKKEGYTYVYLDNIVDFHINTYHTLFAEVGPGMANDAIYRVEYDDEGQLKLRFIAQD